MMLLVATLLAQVALALCCSWPCEERREYYSSYTTTQPTYDYPEYQYNPYSPTGYSYNYGSYSQPSYDTSSVSAIICPYPVPVVYENHGEEQSCGCKRKHSESPYRDQRRYEEERDYSSSRCTCTNNEREQRYHEDREKKPCGCRKSEDYRDFDRYDREYEEHGRSKVKCVCVYDEFKEEVRDDDNDWERRSSRRDNQRCRHKESNRDCGCGRKNKQY